MPFLFVFIEKTLLIGSALNNPSLSLSLSTPFLEMRHTHAGVGGGFLLRQVGPQPPTFPFTTHAKCSAASFKLSLFTASQSALPDGAAPAK